MRLDDRMIIQRHTQDFIMIITLVRFSSLSFKHCIAFTFPVLFYIGSFFVFFYCVFSLLSGFPSCIFLVPFLDSREFSLLYYCVLFFSWSPSPLLSEMPELSCIS